MQVHLYGLQVEVASHLCRSLSITVCSHALDIWDASDKLKAAWHERKSPAVISIGHQQPGRGSYTGLMVRRVIYQLLSSASYRLLQAAPSLPVYHSVDGLAHVDAYCM